MEEEIERGLGRITLNIAGSNHSVTVEIVADEDFGVLSRILEKNPYSNGLDVSFHLCMGCWCIRHCKTMSETIQSHLLNPYV